jgi:hypothetical protein
MTIAGTSYFPSIEHARLYYGAYFYKDTVEAVMRKIEEGEIHIGKPPLKEGDTLFIKDNRYYIQSK